MYIAISEIQTYSLKF